MRRSRLDLKLFEFSTSHQISHHVRSPGLRPRKQPLPVFPEDLRELAARARTGILRAIRGLRCGSALLTRPSGWQRSPLCGMYSAPGRLRPMSRCLIFKPRRQRAVSPAADSQARPQPPQRGHSARTKPQNPAANRGQNSELTNEATRHPGRCYCPGIRWSRLSRQVAGAPGGRFRQPSITLGDECQMTRARRCYGRQRGLPGSLRRYALRHSGPWRQDLPRRGTGV